MSVCALLFNSGSTSPNHKFSILSSPAMDGRQLWRRHGWPITGETLEGKNQTSDHQECARRAWSVKFWTIISIIRDKQKIKQIPELPLRLLNVPNSPIFSGTFQPKRHLPLSKSLALDAWAQVRQNIISSARLPPNSWSWPTCNLNRSVPMISWLLGASCNGRFVPLRPSLVKWTCALLCWWQAKSRLQHQASSKMHRWIGDLRSWRSWFSKLHQISPYSLAWGMHAGTCNRILYHGASVPVFLPSK